MKMTTEKPKAEGDCSSASCSLPDWFEIDDKIREGKPTTALERFIHANEPVESDEFRAGLAAAIKEAENS